jgi:hypothetical protein
MEPEVAPPARPAYEQVLPPNHRPLPRVPSVLAAAGGVMLVAGFVVLIGQFPDSQRRWLAILTAVILEAAAVAGLWALRHRPTYTGAVTVSLLGVLPAWFFLVVDPHSRQPFESPGDLKTKATIILLLAIVGWVLLFFLAPVARQTVFAAAGLAALAILLVIQIAFTTSSPRIVGQPAPAGHATHVHPAAAHQTGDDGSSDSFGSTDPYADDYSDSYGDDYSDSYSDDYSDSYSDDYSDSFSDDYSDSYGDSGSGSFDGSTSELGPLAISPADLFGVDFAPGKFASVLVVLGLLYLGAATLLDKAGQSRIATAGFAIGVPVVTVGLVTSGATDFGLWGASILGLLIALGVTWSGVKGARRFTSWFAGVGVVIALAAMIIRLFSKSATGGGVALLLCGLAIIVVVDRVAKGPTDPFPHDDGRLPGRPGTPPPTASPAFVASPAVAGDPTTPRPGPPLA